MPDKIDFLLAALRGDATPGSSTEETGPAPTAPDTGLLSAPPVPPSEQLLSLQAQVELLERKLQLAQERALQAETVLDEREKARDQAQREVEDLFYSMREQARASTWDRALRDHYSSAQSHIRELEEELRLAQLSMISADAVLRYLEGSQDPEELKTRLRKQLEEFHKRAGEKPPEPPISRVAPFSGETTALAAVIGRLVDLERRLGDSERLKDEERKRHEQWEKNILQALNQIPMRWARSGGPEVLVEATLESITEAVREREGLRVEMKRLLASMEQEPPDSSALPEMRHSLAKVRQRADELQWRLDKQMTVVTAWLQRK